MPDLQSHTQHPRKRFPWMLGIIISSGFIIIFAFIVITLLVLRSQGPSQGINTLTILSIVGGFVIGVLSLLVSFLQWHHPKDPPASEKSVATSFVQTHSPTMSEHLQSPILLDDPQRQLIEKTTVALAPMGQTKRRFDWGEAPHIDQLYGRDKEVTTLKQWLMNDHCRLVVILGMGGIGKTGLAATLVDQVHEQYDYVFWRTLYNAPPLESLLQECIQFFSLQTDMALPGDVDRQIPLLLEAFRNHHCLLILDNAESILQGGSQMGHYREGYEGYGRLIQRIGESKHHSCLLITSREKPPEVALLEGEAARTRSLQLGGLKPADGQGILKDKGLQGTEEDLPQLAASAPRAALPTIWNIPYPRNPFFLGRESELAQMRQHLQASQTAAHGPPQAISGLGGIGKTQLALEYAYRYHQDYQIVLWARAESIEALISSYITIASLLRLPQRDAKEQDINVQAVKTWLQTHRDWLLILDNADELMIIPDFLPSTLGGHLLLTTRAATTGRLAHRLEIETLLPEQGALFLLRRSGLIAPDAVLGQVSQEEQKLAMQISQELGGLPLALDQAGGYLEEMGTDLASYWQIYQQHRDDLLQKRGGLVADHPASVATTWLLSFQQIEKKNPAAADLLRTLAFLSPDAIPEEILTAGASHLGQALAPVAADAFLLNQAIKALRAYSLVRRDPKGKTLSVHRLVQAMLQNALEEKERRCWVERAMLAVNTAFPDNAAFPDVEHSTWLQCERLLSHVLLVAHYIEADQISRSEAGQLLYQTACYLRERGRYPEAEPLYQQALHIWELRLGPNHSQVAYPLYGLAVLYRMQGKFAKAEPFYQQALHIWELRLGPNHSQVAYPLVGLANLYSNQGKYAKAEPLYQRAMHILEQGMGPDHPHLGVLLDNLAGLYHSQGKYAEAKPLHQQALHILEQRMGPNDPHLTYPLGNLADLYSNQGKFAEAEPLYQQALHIWEQQAGPPHPNVALLLDGLANLYSDQGKFAEAEPLYQRALHISEQQLGPQHPETADIIHDLARFWEAQDNDEEASVWYARALAIREQTLGAQHPKTTETHTRLIVLLQAMGHYEEAAQLERVQDES